MRRFPFAAIIFTSIPSLTFGQISVRSEDNSSTPLKQYFYNWNGFEVQWFGNDIRHTDEDDWDGAFDSNGSFTLPYANNSFAYSVTAVQDWDTASAHAAVLSSAGEPANTSPFVAYLNGLTGANVNKHSGSQHGFGVDNGNNDVDANRRDKIDDLGEALIITFDLNGDLNMEDAAGHFGPEEDANFEHTGLNPYAQLTLEDLLIKKYSTNAQPTDARIDFLFYDVSEGTFVKNSAGDDGFYEYFNLDASGFIIDGPWTIEHGDILVLAHPTNSDNDLSMLSNELWSMTFDLDFLPPSPATLEIPADPSDFPQHPHGPGFSNIWRTDGELIAMYRTEAGNDTIRNIVLDFHRGYLITENRGSSVGNSRIVFDIADVTSESPSVADPEDRTLDQVLIEPMRGAMHYAYSLAPDYRVNHPGDSYVDLSGLADGTPTITEDYPEGFVEIGGGARSAYVLPYHYSSSSSAKTITDARTGKRLSLLDEHGFGSDSIPIPVGNILLLARIRSSERAIASYDISDPSNPVLLDVLREEDPRWRDTAAGAYEPSVYSNYFILPQSRLGGSIAFMDYSDPTDLRMHHLIKGTDGSERYLTYQDHRMFAGTEVIDLTHVDGGITPTEHSFPGHKGEYMLPIGNLVVCAENSEQGSSNLGAIYAFQAEPDVRAPTVAYHVPAADAEDQLITTRIGLIIHETLDLTTLDLTTLRVFPVSDLSETSIEGTIVVSDKDVVTFTPMQDLEYNTTYRVVAEGFTDTVGNPIERFSFDFTTASEDSLFYPEVTGIDILNTSELIAGQPVNLSFDATPDNGEDPSTLEYKWDFGDGTVTDWSHGNQTVSHVYLSEGQYRISANVRSSNAPHLAAAAPQVMTSVFRLPAGVDGFEPRYEAEDLAGAAIGTSDSASNGEYSTSSTMTFEFDAVRGNYEFVIAYQSSRNNSSIRSKGVFFSRGVIDEDGNYSYPETEKLGAFGSTSTSVWDEFSVNAYLPSSGRYRIELQDSEGTRNPRVDYLDILMGGSELILEAEAASDIQNASTQNSAEASGGEFVDGQGGFNILWNFEAEEASDYTVSFQIGSPDTSRRTMGVFVNDSFVRTISTEFNGFESILMTLSLDSGINTIELRDSEGEREPNVDYLAITIPEYVAPEEPTPLNSSQIALDSINRRVISVNPDNGSIVVIDADTLALEQEIDVPGNPRSVAVGPNGMIWVTRHDDDSIRVIDLSNASNNIDLALGYGTAPHDILINKDRSRAYISLYGTGQVISLDTNDYSLIDSTNTGPFPMALALRDNEQTLLTTRFISQSEAGEVYSIEIDTNSGAMTQNSTIELAKDTTSEDDANSGRGLPNYLSSILIDPSETSAYVASQKVNTLAGMFREGTTLNHDSTVRSIMSSIDLESSAEDFDSRIDFDNSSQPSAIAFGPNGNYQFVAFQGNNEIRVLNAQTKVNIFTLEVGLAPQALLFDEATNYLYAKNFMSRSITVHDLSAALQNGDFTETNRIDISTVATEVLDDEILLGKQIFYNASDPRMGSEHYISCASCHQDGGHDGMVWDFTQRGEGLRNTIDLRGRAGMGHGNVHWSANFDEIQDFELDMVLHQGGSGFIENGDPHPSMGAPNAGRSDALDALAAYVSSLGEESLVESPHRTADGAFSGDALAGKSLFMGDTLTASGNTLNCMTCHSPESQFTISQTFTADGLARERLFNVGTLKNSSGTRLTNELLGIDPPTLIGLHNSAPYLHDGSAATLEAVFDQFVTGASIGTDGAAHNLGSTGYNLTADEKSQIMAYLKQLDQADWLPDSPPPADPTDGPPQTNPGNNTERPNPSGSNSDPTQSETENSPVVNNDEREETSAGEQTQGAVPDYIPIVPEESSPWQYSERIGWVYTSVSEEDDGVWLYSHDLQSWYWTTDGSYPYAYDYDNDKFVYFYADENGRFIYSFELRAWERIGDYILTSE